MEPLHRFLIIAGPLAFVGAIFWWFFRCVKKRNESLRAVAAEIGLLFPDVKDEALLARMEAFPLFNRGRGRTMRNVMTTETEAMSLTIFDYHYTTGGGQSSYTHKQTVVAIEPSELKLRIFLCALR